MVKKKKNKKKNRRKKSVANKPKTHQDFVISQESLKKAILTSNTDEQFDRIYKILGIEQVEDEDECGDRASVNYENLLKYLEFLKKEVTYPVVVTGIEDMGCFGWEEFYTFGPGSKSEYEKLKKKYPSFKDKYELLCLNEDFDDEEGLCVDVQRIHDKKRFTLTLADLKTVEKNTKNTQFFDDYAVWHTNFR